MKFKLLLASSLMYIFLGAFSQNDTIKTEELLDMSFEDLLNMEVTTASKSAEKQSDAPGIITVLTQDELERFGGTTLKDVLERVPGLISSTVSYSNRTTMVVRGDYIKQNSSHILVLINGRPVREVQEGGVSSEIFNSFPVGIIERIEVIKGPGSVLYGSDAFSGVINIITKEADKNSLSITGKGGDGGAFGVSGEGTLKVNDLNIVAAGNYYEKSVWNAPYTAPNYVSIPDPPYYQVVNVTNNIKIPDKGTGLYLGANYKGLSIMTSYDEWSTLGTQIYNDVTNKKLFTNVGYNYKMSEIWNMDFNVTYTHSELFGDSLSERSNNNTIAEWTNFITLSNKSKLTVGGSFSNINGTETNLQNPDSTYVISDGKNNAFALYAQIDYKLLKSLKLIAGMQTNKVGELDLSIVPRGGLIWYPFERLSVKALYSEAYRAPSINELYMNFPDGLYGDENLKPEKVATIDFGVNYQGEQGQVGASFFYSKQKDIIQPVFFPMSFERQYTNLDAVTFMGGEFEGKYYINKSIYVNLSALYQTNENDSVKNLTPVANFGLKSGISYMWDKGITISLFDIYQGDLDKKFIGTLNPDQGAYNLLHLHSNFKINKLFNLQFKPQISMFLDIDNILDKKVYMYDWGGFTYDALPVNPGRAIYFGLKVKL